MSMYNIEINREIYEAKEKKEILDILTEQSVIRIYQKKDFESDYEDTNEEKETEYLLLQEAFNSSNTLICVTYPHIEKGIICDSNNFDSIITFASSSPYHQIIVRENGKIVIGSLYRPQWSKKCVDSSVFLN